MTPQEQAFFDEMARMPPIQLRRVGREHQVANFDEILFGLNATTPWSIDRSTRRGI